MNQTAMTSPPSFTETVTYSDVSVTSLEFLPPGENAQQYSVTDVLSYFYFLVGGIGLLGNTFVVVVIFSLTSMRKQVTNMFIINQSIIDWLTALLLILGIVFGEDGFMLSGVLGELYCRLWLNKAIQWCTQLASTYNLLAITLERYLAVVYPIKYKLFVSTTKALIAIFIIWFVSFFIQLSYAIPPAGLLDGRCNLLRFWPSPAFQRGVGVFLIIIKFFIPLLVMTFCYTRMVLVLKTRIFPSSDTGTSNKGEDKRERARKNIFKTLAIVTICFAACWTSNQVYFFMFNLGFKFKNVFTNPFYHFTVMMVYVNSAVNPFIYIAKYEQFQKGVLKLRHKFMMKVGFKPRTEDSSAHMSTISTTMEQ